VIPAAFDIPLWDSVSAVISLLHSYAEDVSLYQLFLSSSLSRVAQVE